jgi:hypothetical protein
MLIGITMNINNKTYLAILLFFSSLFILLNFSSCDEGPTEPNVEPGRRDYTWSEDTLQMGNESLTLTRIWANSPTDVWVLGFGTTSRIQIWHYNGVVWEAEPIATGMIRPKAIFGFGNYDIWIGTAESQIWHNNGNGWSLFHTLKLEGYTHIALENIYGISRDNVYGVGYALNYPKAEYKGIIVHFNGISWSFVDIPVIRANLPFIHYEKSSKLYYIMGMGETLEYIYTFDGKNFKEIISSDAGYGVGAAGNYVFINSNQKVFSYRDKKVSLWQDFTGTSFIGNVNGRNEKDFINNAYDGIGHYDGTDYKTIYTTNLDLNGYSVLEEDIFAISQDRASYKSIIIHGTLNKN